MLFKIKSVVSGIFFMTCVFSTNAMVRMPRMLLSRSIQTTMTQNLRCLSHDTLRPILANDLFKEIESTKYSNHLYKEHAEFYMWLALKASDLSDDKDCDKNKLLEAILHMECAKGCTDIILRSMRKEYDVFYSTNKKNGEEVKQNFLRSLKEEYLSKGISEKELDTYVKLFKWD